MKNAETQFELAPGISLPQASLETYTNAFNNGWIPIGYGDNIQQTPDDLSDITTFAAYHAQIRRLQLKTIEVDAIIKENQQGIAYIHMTKEQTDE